ILKRQFAVHKPPQSNICLTSHPSTHSTPRQRSESVRNQIVLPSSHQSMLPYLSLLDQVQASYNPPKTLLLPHIPQGHKQRKSSAYPPMKIQMELMNNPLPIHPLQQAIDEYQDTPTHQSQIQDTDSKIYPEWRDGAVTTKHTRSQTPHTTGQHLA